MGKDSLNFTDANSSANLTKVVINEETFVKEILATFICSAGFFGNAATIILMLRRNRMSRPINWLVLNLSLVNLAIVSITIPYDLIHDKIDWPFGEIGCKYLVMPVMEHFAAVSVLTHTAVGVARYLTIRKSRRGYQVVTYRFTIILIILIWIVSFLVLSVTLMGFLGEFRMFFKKQKIVCELSWISKNRQKTYRICVFILTYIIPSSMTGFSYHQMQHVVNRSLRTVHNHLAPDLFLTRRQKHQRMNKTFMTMFILFTLTTFPLQLFLFLIDFKILKSYENIRMTFHILMIVFYSQVVINPFVLFYMSDEYRKELCCCIKPIKDFVIKRLMRNRLVLGSAYQLNHVELLNQLDETLRDNISLRSTCV